jgi:DNA-binding beta-propeller fold protein YncE
VIRGKGIEGGRIASRSWRRLFLAAGLTTVLASAAPASAAIVQRVAWGTFGPGAGQFGDAQGVEPDSAGHVYVADTSNHRIQVFSPRGEFILAWGWGVRNGQSELQTCRSSCQSGLAGLGQGQLGAPNGLAPDPEGHVYVADTGQDRVQKFSAGGRFLDQWGSEGAGPGQFDGPVDIALGPAGRVYVADFFNHRIQVFSPGGHFLDQWDADYPYGLAVDPAGNIYVAESDPARVESFSPRGRLLTAWGEFGSRPGYFSFPRGVATDSARRVYVSDSGNDRIQKFSRSGRFLTTWGEFGYGNGQFNGPNDVAVDSAGHVYVADTSNDRIVKYAQVPPRTTITASRVSDARRRAKFRFKSSEPGSSFRCKLDHRRRRRCDSPKVYRHLSEGRHTFRVRAIGPDKLRDPTPAKKRFWIGE